MCVFSILGSSEPLQLGKLSTRPGLATRAPGRSGESVRFSEVAPLSATSGRGEGGPGTSGQGRHPVVTQARFGHRMRIYCALVLRLNYAKPRGAHVGYSTVDDSAVPVRQVTRPPRI